MRVAVLGFALAATCACPAGADDLAGSPTGEAVVLVQPVLDPRRLARGRGIDAKSLRLRGSVVSWSNRRRRDSARLR